MARKDGKVSLVSDESNASLYAKSDVARRPAETIEEVRAILSRWADTPARLRLAEGRRTGCCILTIPWPSLGIGVT